MSKNLDIVEVNPISLVPVILITPAPAADSDLDDAKILRDLSRLPPKRGDLLADAEVEYS